MTLIVCVDERMGMAFGGRRQSRDKAVCHDIAMLAAGRLLRMDPRSAKLFEGEDCRILSDADFISAVQPGDVCFLEFSPAESAAACADTLVLYRWNRHYPADLRFNASLSDWQLAETAEFAGTSHEKITKEVYKRA